MNLLKQLKRLSLTQPVLNEVASKLGGPALLREKRNACVTMRRKLVAEHKQALATLDKVIERIDLALGQREA